MTKTTAHSLVITMLLTAGAGGIARANDWLGWRGPEQNGYCREKAAVTSWTTEGENLLWKSPLGGRSTPAVLNGRLFAAGPVGSGEGTQERLFCLNADTGAVIWEHHINVFDTDIVENRVGWASPVGDPETENVYFHTTGGQMLCYDRDGKLLWDVSMTEMFGRISGYGGRIDTPIIDEDRVIVSYLNSAWGENAKPFHRYVAFDKRTGQVQWWASPGGTAQDTTYSTAVVAVIDGVRMLIGGNADGGIYGMKARTGEVLWSFAFSKRGINSSVVTSGNYVYACHSEENLDNTEMGRCVCIDATLRGDITKTGEVWRFAERTVGYASPAVAGDRIYFVDNAANLYAVDIKTGKQIWEFSLGRVGKGSPSVTADGVIYVAEQNGVFHILRDDNSKCVSLDKKEFTRSDNLLDEIYGSPALAGGRVYFMTRYGTYCLGKKDAKVEPVPIPAMAAETPAAAGANFLQITPGDVTLAPGEKAQFTVHRYDANGRHLRTENIPLTPTNIAGSVTADGAFTASNDNHYAAGHIVARADGLEAKARVRILPKPPFKEDFESMALESVPAGWIGVAAKTQIVERDGSKVLRKLSSKERPSPPFMRIRGYNTAVIRGGYTVQCDVLGTPKGDRFKPDIGLANSRYTMTLLGIGQQIRVDSWSTLPRVRKEVPFPWETNKWYRMKFQVKLELAQAVLRGKIWLRDDKEPEAWSIELVDPYPNREGAAAVYGYSPGTTSKSDGPEIFYDNYQVTQDE